MKIIIVPEGKTLFFTAGNYIFKGPQVLREWVFAQKTLPKSFTDGTDYEVLDIEETPEALREAIAASRVQKQEPPVEEVKEVEVEEPSEVPKDTFFAKPFEYSTEDQPEEDPEDSEDETPEED